MAYVERVNFVIDRCFEAWIGRPYAHGTEHFALHAQLPVRQG